MGENLLENRHKIYPCYRVAENRKLRWSAIILVKISFEENDENRPHINALSWYRYYDYVRWWANWLEAYFVYCVSWNEKQTLRCNKRINQLWKQNYITLWVNFWNLSRFFFCWGALRLKFGRFVAAALPRCPVFCHPAVLYLKLFCQITAEFKAVWRVSRISIWKSGHYLKVQIVRFLKEKYYELGYVFIISIINQFYQLFFSLQKKCEIIMNGL